MSKRESPDAMLDKMVLAATLYYKEKLSQQEIAKRLNVSRPWVSKLLSRAEDLGIVKIEIVSPLSGNSELERNLCEKYGLQHAGVAEKKDRDYVSLAAAQYFVSQLESNDVVGIGWGDAISRFLRELTPLHLPNVQPTSKREQTEQEKFSVKDLRAVKQPATQKLTQSSLKRSA